MTCRPAFHELARGVYGPQNDAQRLATSRTRLEEPVALNRPRIDIRDPAGFRSYSSGSPLATAMAAAARCAAASAAATAAPHPTRFAPAADAGRAEQH